MNYPQHAGDAERAAWALFTGIDLAIVVFGSIIMAIFLLSAVGEWWINRKP